VKSRKTGKARKKREASRERLLERLHAAVDHGDIARARGLLPRIEQGADDAFAAFARWRVAALDDDLEPALEIARRDVARFAEEPELQHALGWTLLELGRLDEAIPHLEEACFLDRDFADAWHDLAIVREATGDLAGMRQAFTEVFEIDTAPDPPPLRFTPEQVMQWAERAIESLRPDVREAIPNVPIFVEDYPEAWILEDSPWDPRLLGLFDGPTRAQVMGSEAPADIPKVYLYLRNLERECADARDMAEQVRITVLHELGHFLDLDEHDMDERGLA
jgi:predicted Zn-dependent protease with MMP-like domain